MKTVRATKQVFDGSRRIRKGEIVQIPKDTKGEWYQDLAPQQKSSTEKK